MWSSGETEDQSRRHLVEMLMPLAHQAESLDGLQQLFEETYHRRPAGPEIAAIKEAWKRAKTVEM